MEVIDVDIFVQNMIIICKSLTSKIFTILFNFSKKIRRKLFDRRDDADTDSYSDEDFVTNRNADGTTTKMTEEEKRTAQHSNLELLEKG